MRLVPLALVVALSSTAFAEAPTPRERKSERLAIGATVAGIAMSTALTLRFVEEHNTGETTSLLAITAVLVLPAAGHIYAEDWLWTGIGITTRTVAVFMMMKGSSLNREDCGFDGPCERTGVAKTLLTGGAAMLVGSLVGELVHAPYSVNQFNERHAITVTPTPMSGGGGVSFAGTF